MSGQDKRTRAELITEIGYSQIAVDQEREARTEAERQHEARWKARDPEAVAIETCAKALRALIPDRSRGSGDYMAVSQYLPGRTNGTAPDEPSVARVLDYLRDRFGIPAPQVAVDEGMRNELTEARNRLDAAHRALEQVRALSRGVS